MTKFGTISVESLKVTTAGFFPKDILEAYPFRYTDTDNAFKIWLINELSHNDRIIAKMEGYAGEVMAGKDINLLFHYLMDGFYCHVIKEILEEAIRGNQS